MAQGNPEMERPATSFDLPESLPDLHHEALVVLTALQAELGDGRGREETLSAIERQGRQAGLSQREVRVLRFLAISDKN